MHAMYQVLPILLSQNTTKKALWNFVHDKTVLFNIHLNKVLTGKRGDKFYGRQVERGI